MCGAGNNPSSMDMLTEGKVKLCVTPSGKDKGPGSRGGVFFNPAMVQNRDLSVVIIDMLSELDLFPGKRKRVLDGLCGSGARAVRFGVESRLLEDGVGIVGTDLNPGSIMTARTNGRINDVNVEFFQTDLNEHLMNERYSYVDIDPFGSPVPFIQNALLGTLNGGFLGITATDTAALTGSIPRVAYRRYGTIMKMTHAYQEISCRTLMGYVARTAAAFERSVEPVFFYSSDHFVRGYIRVWKGARKADRSLENVRWVRLPDPGPPIDRSVEPGGLGPIWTGDLDDPQIVRGLLDRLSDEGRWGYLASRKNLLTLLDRAISENGLPIMGYDLNLLASYLGTSPPSMDKVFSELNSLGRKVSRSRFSPTIFKTDASREEVHAVFLSRRA